MALKSTIFKAELQIADMERNYYREHVLTLARHPSETDERLMVRLLAFALNASDSLAFGRGLSAEDEPDLWQKYLTGVIELWIEVGLPDPKAIRRACGRARQVKLYCYGGSAAALWWQQAREVLGRSDNLTVIDLTLESTRAMAALAQRNMQLQCTVQDGLIWLHTDEGAAQVEPVTLKQAA